MRNQAGNQRSLGEWIDELLWQQNPADLNAVQRTLLRQVQTVALVSVTSIPINACCERRH